MTPPGNYRAPESLLRLEGSRSNRTLLLVSCGPSATRWKDVLAGLPAATDVACIKQAIFLCGSRASLHFFNAFNCQRYFPHNRHALKVYVDDEGSPLSFNASDFVFTLDPETCKGVENSVAVTGRFADYTIENAGLRKPWGPGIMYEIVFYMALFLGFRDIHTIGWDVPGESAEAHAKGSSIPHFYDGSARRSARPRTQYEWEGAHPTLYRYRSLVRHVTGRPYNRMPKVDPAGEIPIIVGAIPHFLNWVESEGASLTIHTQLRGHNIDPAVRRHVTEIVTPPLHNAV